MDKFAILLVDGDCTRFITSVRVGETVTVESGGMISGAGASVQLLGIAEGLDEAQRLVDEQKAKLDSKN